MRPTASAWRPLSSAERNGDRVRPRALAVVAAAFDRRHLDVVPARRDQGVRRVDLPGAPAVRCVVGDVLELGGRARRVPVEHDVAVAPALRLRRLHLATEELSATRRLALLDRHRRADPLAGVRRTGDRYKRQRDKHTAPYMTAHTNASLESA